MKDVAWDNSEFCSWGGGVGLGGRKGGLVHVFLPLTPAKDCLTSNYMELQLPHFRTYIVMSRNCMLPEN